MDNHNFFALVLILGTGKVPGAAKLGKAVEYNKAKNEIQEQVKQQKNHQKFQVLLNQKGQS